MKAERKSTTHSVNSPIMFAMQLAKHLKALLRENDITVAQLARKADVSAKTIYNWLSGQSPKDIEAVKRVANQFKVSLDFLCYGEIKPSKSEIEHHLDEINAGIFEVVLRRPKK